MQASDPDFWIRRLICFCYRAVRLLLRVAFGFYYLLMTTLRCSRARSVAACRAAVV